MVINPVLSVLSYSFAAQSLLAPFAGLSIVWSLLFSAYLLPESPDKSKYKSTLLITLYPFLTSALLLHSSGCLLISLSASHTNTSFSVRDLALLSRQPSYVLFCTLYSVTIILLAFISFGNTNERLENYRGSFFFLHIMRRLAIGLLSGSLSGNQTYIKGLSVIIAE